MEGWLDRTQALLGSTALEKLKSSRVLILGMGGVGCHAVEALARSGVGGLDLLDHDRFSLTNLNRQLFATHSSLGELKVEAAKRRIEDINPSVKTRTFPLRYCGDTAQKIDLAGYDYIVDAIDSVDAKLLLLKNAFAEGVPIISCMGTGNKLNPMALKVADIFQTSVCPLARRVRGELKKLGIKKLKVVFSDEPPSVSIHPPSSNAFVPAAAGLLLAAEVVKDLAAL